jgi:hypothetical protein
MRQLNSKKNVARTQINENKLYNNGYVRANMIGIN